MRIGFPELYGSNEIIRYHYRANHIYILLSSLLNIVLGCYLRQGVGWRKRVALAGSLLLFSAPLVLVAAFFLEAPKGTPDRLITLAGIFMVFIGTAFQAPSRS